MHLFQRAAAVATTLLFSASVQAANQVYSWKNVKIGGGGGFVPGIVFNPTEKGLAYARTDIGGAYRLNPDDSWTPITEFVGNANWNQWGIDALATDPVDTNRVYLAAGMYTISWDPNPGSILRSSDKGNTWQSTTLPFKVGGNMPGRGAGERLVVDPNKNNILFFGTRNNGLWKSTDYGATWAKVNSFIWTGTYFQSNENEYTQATQGLAWVTFDKTSGVAGTATPRIFVGLIDKGTNVFKSEDGGATWAPVAGQPTNAFIPHKAVLSPSDKLLYISYANASGPYDGSLGTVNKYNITSGVWTDISPTPLSSTYYGYGGLTVDLQKPGTLMVAALNQWWPDATIWRSTNSGATWSPIWEFTGYPARNKYYSYDISLAPWLQDNTNTDEFKAQIGWMIESLEIDPHDSNHWLYGTGATIYGGRDLLKWDTTHNVTVKSLADGIEETAILDLISPPGGPPLLSAVGDIGGFYHSNLDVAPSQAFHTPTYGSTLGIDYAGNKPANIVRTGYNSAAQPQPQVAVSSNFGASWSANWAAQPGTVAPGKIAYSADGDTILLSGSAGPLVSKQQATFSAVSTLPSGAAIASDKRNTTVFYGGSAGSFYLSTNSGATFAKTVALGTSTSVNDITVHPTVAGDVWASTDAGLFHSTNYGVSFTQVGSGVAAGWSFALGAGATATTYPTIYGFFNVNSVITLYKSEDQGLNWFIISDATHGFGAGSANVVSADMSIYGRVYVGTNGRGIFYGNPSGTLPSGTASSSSISVSKTSSTSSSTTTRSSTATTLSTTTRITSSSTTTTTTTVRTSSTTTTPSPTTTSRVVTTSTTTTSAVSGGATVGPWGKCGGEGYTGPTVCATGYKCVFSNPYYSQCI